MLSLPAKGSKDHHLKVGGYKVLLMVLLRVRPHGWRTLYRWHPGIGALDEELEPLVERVVREQQCFDACQWVGCGCRPVFAGIWERMKNGAPHSSRFDSWTDYAPWPRKNWQDWASRHPFPCLRTISDVHMENLAWNEQDASALWEMRKKRFLHTAPRFSADSAGYDGNGLKRPEPETKTVLCWAENRS